MLQEAKKFPGSNGIGFDQVLAVCCWNPMHQSGHRFLWGKRDTWRSGWMYVGSVDRKAAWCFEIGQRSLQTSVILLRLRRQATYLVILALITPVSADTCNMVFGSELKAL